MNRMKSKGMALGAMFVVALFIGMAFVPTAGAGAHKRYEISEEQIEVANQLVGQDITLGEFMEQVTPEILENMPEKAVEDMYRIKMVWPGPYEPSSEADYPQTATRMFKLASRPTDVQPQQIIPIVIRDVSKISAAWPYIDFSSWSRVCYHILGLGCLTWLYGPICITKMELGSPWSSTMVTTFTRWKLVALITQAHLGTIKREGFTMQ
ncbi:MAG: hypothetical protein QMC77_06895 [Methanocellales archaeon]|nr:hypothetical protein [Methanocellales archaeon]